MVKEQSPVRVKAPPQKSRAVTRVECEETQDYASEPQGLEETDEEMEELSVVPSAVSEPRWALHMCDECSKEGFKFYQLEAIVMEERGAAHTINLCKQCYNVMRMIRCERKMTAPRWQGDN